MFSTGSNHMKMYIRDLVWDMTTRIWAMQDRLYARRVFKILEEGFVAFLSNQVLSRRATMRRFEKQVRKSDFTDVSLCRYLTYSEPQPSN